MYSLGYFLTVEYLLIRYGSANRFMPRVEPLGKAARKEIQVWDLRGLQKEYGQIPPSPKGNEQ